MDNMEELLVQLIETLGYPIIKQGTIGIDEEYPESFFTFWNNETLGNTFYDNKENSVIWYFDLNFYSSNPELVYKELMRAKELLNQHGFIIYGKGHDVKSDEITYTGRGIDVKIIENL
ncbi:MAG: hypothetical protein HFJ51_00600 [Clostridia bacterium]|nr:hypothetical protein [Clostridia bacterium]